MFKVVSTGSNNMLLAFMPNSFPMSRNYRRGAKMLTEESKYTLMASLNGFAATTIGPLRAVDILEVKDWKFRKQESRHSFLPPQVTSRLMNLFFSFLFLLFSNHSSLPSSPTLCL